jgi:hypothetical protein
MKKSLLCVLLLGVSSFASASSAFTTRLDDPKAVYLTAQEFGAHADGAADDSAAIQAAMSTRPKAPTHREGILFVPRGPLPAHTHRVCLAGREDHRLWQHMRPVFVLAEQLAGVSELASP